MSTPPATASAAAAEPSAASSQPQDLAPFFWNEETASRFPPAFVAFLRANNIHPDNYAFHDVPRYVRVSPRHEGTLVQSEIERQLGIAIEPVEWLPGYYRVPSHIKIAGCEAYRSGQLYGIDVSSGAAVVALDPRPGEDVLDLCCAPGAKLCAIADCMQQSGTLTGVDISEQRLASCRTLCTKYGITNARLVLQDGSTFEGPPPRRQAQVHPGVEATAAATEGGGASATGDAYSLTDAGEGAATVGGGDDGAADADESVAAADGKPSRRRDGDGGHPSHHKRRRRDRNDDASGRPFFMGSDLLSPQEDTTGGHAHAQPDPAAGHDAEKGAADAGTDGAAAGGGVGAGHPGYDKVLVDAECTHDGSIKHLAKFAQWGWDTFEKRFLEPTRLQSLQVLQLALLRAGFRALKPGGALVYSTCSFARAQNEDVVGALLAEEPRARLVPVEGLLAAPCRTGELPHTLRFEPRLSRTSGLFVARISKMAT